MKIDRGRLARLVFTLILVACALALAISRQFYDTAILSPFLAFALASTLILHLRVRPFWSDVLFVLGSSAVLGVIDFYVLGFPPRALAGLSFLGFSSLVILGLRTIWAQEQDRRLLLYAFVPALLFLGSDWMSSSLLSLTEAAHPKTLDLYLYSFECSLRMQPSFMMGQVFSRWIWLREVSLLFYLALPIPLALVYAGQLIRRKERALPVMLAFLATGPVGVAFYNLYPATGPIHLFLERFPFHPLTIAQAAHLFLEPVAIASARNAIPSLHMAWVLLAWWSSRGLSWWTRGIALAFLVFTVLATLGIGEHYFIDLVVAYPFALLVRAISSFRLPWRNAGRAQAAIVGALGTFAWLALLRFGVRLFWTSAIVPWALMIATVALSSIRTQRLQRAEDLEQLAADPSFGILPVPVEEERVPVTD